MTDTSIPEVDALFEDDPGPLEEEDTGELNLAEIDTKVWLVKIPKFLAEKWNNLEKDDVELGSVRIFNEGPNGSRGSIQLVLPENEMSFDIPKEYTVNVNDGEVRNKFIFTVNERGVPQGIVGTVHHECHVTPVIGGERYHNILRNRTVESGKSRRTVAFLDRDDQGTFLTPATGNAMPKNTFGEFIQKKQKPTTESKATRMPKNELMDLIFKNFEKYKYWTLKGLTEVLKQPQAYIKEIMSEIGVLNKRGPYTNTYHLKPEFISHVGTSGSQSSRTGLMSSIKDEDVDLDGDIDDEDIDMEEI